MAGRAVMPKAYLSLVSRPLRRTKLAEGAFAARIPQTTTAPSAHLKQTSLTPAPPQTSPSPDPGLAPTPASGPSLAPLFNLNFMGVGVGVGVGPTPTLCAALGPTGGVPSMGIITGSAPGATGGVPSMGITGSAPGGTGGVPALGRVTGSALGATGGVPGLCLASPGLQDLRVPFSLRGLHTATPPPKETHGEAVREDKTAAAPSQGQDETGTETETQRTPSDSDSVTFSDGVTVEKAEDGSGGSYWSIQRPKLFRADGTEWPWKSFRPADTYQANTQVPLDRHFKPNNFGDTFAKYLVKSLRIPTDLFFQRRYGCRAMMLETVAAVPGMVAGMLLHLKSLRLIEHSGGWIKTLLDEAENERMHLMTFMEVAQPKWYERALVFSVQAVFFAAYTGAYIVSPRIAHRIVGYLEEEAVHSYTEFLKDIDAGKIENVPAPKIAIDYWRLPKNATLRDVVVVVRADEAHHRDVNHFAANIVQEGKKLKDYPAPIEYH